MQAPARTSRLCVCRAYLPIFGPRTAWTRGRPEPPTWRERGKQAQAPGGLPQGPGGLLLLGQTDTGLPSNPELGLTAGRQN